MESKDSFGMGDGGGCGGEGEDDGAFIWGDRTVVSRCLLSFFFWSFLILFLSLCVLTGDGMKFSNPGGTDGPEIEGDEGIELVFGFLRRGLNLFTSWMVGLLTGKVCESLFRFFGGLRFRFRFCDWSMFSLDGVKVLGGGEIS